ncbi:Suppressor protein stp22 of temperature-sensitive alpha-factor receptor and arginine permease [Emydomyces testavorans]|uniref:Suppressor protein stp22 of temperature-sensitive alpha-factor receptor and arginine permease n=1 Tax=Emydomyces testavorans TaxID=2070801 RepID=A0AAF0IIQ7_9EURO|nr:Suppressor protein stp22 of temperature-sensitive alpha-factor receptor and arginine permease [Emydomyces testavorans]
MASVSQKTLDWLYRVLTSNSHDPSQGYRDPNRTYNDVAHLLSQYQGFAPRTDVYTYENGSSALLLNLSGTLPVSFRSMVYQFPITVWIPTTYPREAPIVYVTPSQGMLVRPGQHVSGEGRVYHHYLAHWAEASSRSTIVDFLYILRDIFAKEPPVASIQAQMSRPTPPQATPTPPAVPPLPPQLARSEPERKATSQIAQTPPQLPPKPGKTIESQGRREPLVSERYKEPPPLPPLPGFNEPRETSVQQSQLRGQFSNGRNVNHRPYQPNSPDTFAIPSQSYQGHILPHPKLYQQEGRSPTSSITTTAPPLPPLPQTAQYQPPGSVQYDQAVNMHPQPAPAQFGPIPRYEYSSQPLQPPAPPASYQEPTRPKQLTPDLLTSPFDLELPSQMQAAAPPPIPPNPEKDFLLRTLSRTLTQTLRDNVDKTNSGLQPLNSQSQALHAAIATLKSEIAAINSFHATLQSNISILQQSLHRADAVIADARERISSSSSSSSTLPGAPTEHPSSSGRPAPGLPAIDEILVPPTVVGKQIYDLVADERGIERAIYALQAGLVKGRVGLDTWAKLTRSLAREAFLKKALIRKAGVGMGLNVEPGGLGRG